MTIEKAVNSIDLLVANTNTETEKIEWLSRVDAMITLHIMSGYEGEPVKPFEGYDENTPRDTELLAKEPYDELYLSYLEAMIYKYRREYDAYNNAIEDFHAVYEAFGNAWHRNHMPQGGGSFR